MKSRPHYIQYPADFEDEPAAKVPAFNVPGIIVVLCAVIIAIHIVRAYLVSSSAGYWLITTFSFIPASYGPLASQLPVPFAGLWTPLTYSFLHADWTHVFMNLLWMIAFGTPVARRLGAQRFLILSAVSAIAGAALHYVFYVGDLVPVVGASGAVSGYMGAAARFAFPTAGQRGFNVNGPALTLVQSFRNRQFLSFLGVWLALNFLFGSGIVSLVGEGANIAWQAHIGGFFGGLLVFSLLDRKHS